MSVTPELKEALVKLGAMNPELRPHIRPLLKQGADANPFELYEGAAGWEKASKEIESLIEDAAKDVSDRAKKLNTLITKHDKLGAGDSESQALIFAAFRKAIRTVIV